MHPPPTNNSASIILLIACSFVFAYALGVVVHEIGHVLAYACYGIPTKVIVLDPLGHSFMTPVEENAAGELLQRSGGPLFNIVCACLCSAVLWNRSSAYLYPFSMWVSVAFIQESVGMVLDLVNGDDFDWALVAAEGVPTYVIAFFAGVLLLLGCPLFLRMLALAGVHPSRSYFDIARLCVLGISPFFAISLVYAVGFLTSTKDNWVFSKSISLATSIGLSLCFAGVYRPLHPLLSRFIFTPTARIGREHLIASILLAVTLLAACKLLSGPM